MAYQKTEWKARKGTNLDRFEMQQLTANVVILRNAPTVVTDPGTSFNVENMNHIEQGIEDAHKDIAATLTEAREYTDNCVSNEASLRKHGDAGTLAKAKSYTDNINTGVQNILNNLTEFPEWNADNHILTFTAHNGATLVIDFPLESLARDIGYDPLTKEIILFRYDGSEIKIDVSDLIDVYTGSVGTHVQVEVGDDNIIHASLLSGTVDEGKLTTALLSKINNKLDKEHDTNPNAHNEKFADYVPKTALGASVATLKDGQIPVEQIPLAEIGAVAKTAALTNQAAAFGQSARSGTATTAAASDHYHALPNIATSSWNPASDYGSLGLGVGEIRSIIIVPENDIKTSSYVTLKVSNVGTYSVEGYITVFIQGAANSHAYGGYAVSGIYSKRYSGTYAITTSNTLSSGTDLISLPYGQVGTNGYKIVGVITIKRLT